jgi:hypothetical protein
MYPEEVAHDSPVMPTVDEFSQGVVEFHEPSVSALAGRKEEREIVRESSNTAQRTVSGPRALLVFNKLPYVHWTAICNPSRE